MTSSLRDEIERSTWNTPCWEWLGWKNTKGYGYFRDGKRMKMAHRAIYEAVRGPIAPGLQLDHLCCYEPCVNPWHLEAVTAKENNRRSASPTAANGRRTHCKNGHEYSLIAAHQTRGGRGWRFCRACNVERTKRWRATKCAPESGPLLTNKRIIGPCGACGSYAPCEHRASPESGPEER